MKHVCSTPKSKKQAEHYFCYQNDDNAMVVPHIHVEGWYCNLHAQEVLDTIIIKLKENEEALKNTIVSLVTIIILVHDDFYGESAAKEQNNQQHMSDRESQ
jgi:hypothetical protein